ncbi:MAG: DDE-type integrase/transposase/recombinase [Candidatus Lokiarchaeota archaeon]|nr:DDE-type integrase/transposase/recombinase [Candidatus Lokiarchaeota archaeon]
MSLDWIPARAITPKEKGNRGIIPTKKNQLGEVQYESCLERDLLLLAIHCPGVKLIHHQPETISYTDSKGKLRRYTPDVYLEFIDGNRYLIEVKYEEDIIANKSKYEERWEAARQHANNTAMKFIVLHEGQIRKPRWFNVWFTLGSSKCRTNDRYMDKINQIIPSTGVEYNSLCHILAKEFDVNLGKAAQIICFAIYHGLVYIENFSTKRLSAVTFIFGLTSIKTPPFTLLYNDFNEDQINDDFKSDSKQFHALSKKEIALPNQDSHLEDREKMMLEWYERPKYLRTAQWRECFCNKWGISKSQFYRLLKRYEENGRKGLLSRIGNAGRKVVFDEIVMRNMELGRKFFIMNNLATFNQAYNHLRKICEDDGVTLPSFSAFKKFIYRNSKKMDRDSKKGTEYVKTFYNPSLKSFQGACQCLQVVEFDNSFCNIFIADEEKREYLDRPKMTAGIDCRSGMITGFNLSHFDSSSRSVLEALVQTIPPKNDYTEMFNTQHEWPIQGIPVAILVDNGMDYRAKKLADFCKRYDIILEFVPIKTPRYKAYIEQFFNVLTKAMLQESLPGVDIGLSRRLVNPDLKPEKNAALTLDELEEWMHKWIVDTYHFTNRYDDHKYAPHFLINETEDKKTRIILPLPRESPTSPQDIDELYLSILQPTVLVVT